MKEVNVSIITIGDELLIGQTIDTNSAFIGQELNKAGAWVKRRVAVGDISADIRKALDEETVHADIIILTGGLGPTADDITKPLLCEYFGGRLVINEEVLAHVKHLFENVFQRKGALLERNVKQAEVPDVCQVLFNKRGTAPGMLFKKNNKAYFSLPGVPHEMKGLMTDQVIPWIVKHYQFPAIIHKTLLTAGTGESVIAELLTEFESSLPTHIRLAYLPNYGMVKLRLTGRSPFAEILEKELTAQFLKLQQLVKEYLVWDADESLEIVISKILIGRKKSLGAAESCTGGYISHLLTSVPGSSAYYKGSIIAYDDEVKKNVLGVKQSTLSAFGAVSAETVKEMVNGTLRTFKTDYALATSGIMGPGGGSELKPVGSVWIAVGNKEKTEVLQLHLRFDRQRNIITTASIALNFLRKFILTNS